jgi:restriction endonuclease Mrr
MNLLLAPEDEVNVIFAKTEFMASGFTRYGELRRNFEDTIHRTGDSGVEGGLIHVCHR